MLVNEAVNTKTVILMIDDSFGKAKEMMDELHVNSLPVINPSTNEVVGRIDRDKLETGDAKRLISEQDLEDSIVIFNNQHLFEAIRTMLEYENRLTAGCR